ncbi:type II secretion system secretin GspD [Musicola keenii]|uniref:type II secretion system secretin GspD n=1 Tax=Musicola keenii TaxID=2884250 RepID=UPI001783DC8D
MLGKGIMKRWGWLGLTALLISSTYSWSAEFSASFKGTDIQEFINTVSKNLNKTVIIDPTVRGTITVRSYDMMNEEQYYQFFLSVLDVYGFSVVPMDNGVLKVIRSKDAKSSAIPVANDEQPGVGDELVTRVVPLNNVAARDLAPLLRQLNDNAGAGSVVHYEPSNVLLMTGRAAVVKRLMEIVSTVDKTGDRNVVTIPLTYASADDVAKLVNDLNKTDEKNALPSTMVANVVADGRTNSVVVSGEDNARQRVVEMIHQFDRKQVVQGGTKVIYLKYAKALDLIEVLAGNGTSGNRNSSSTNNRSSSTRSGSSSSNSSSSSANSSSNSSSSSNSGNGSYSSSGSGMGFGSTFGSSSSSGGRTIIIQGKEVIMRAHDQTNSLIITAPPDIMRDLEQVINQLDIRRPQVLVEAIIAEVQDADGLNLGIQWANKRAGMTQYTNTGMPISTAIVGVDQYRDDGTLTSNFSSALGSFNGIAAGFYHGNWSMLLTALSSNSKNDVLATPSIVTIDNMEATFNVGQEVPVLTGSQTTSADNIYSTVERKTVGIKLKVKPQINEGDSVLLQIEQEVSSVADSSSSTSSDLGATFNTRTVNNAVMVTNGETVVVGGLLNKSTVETDSKVPLLGDIPVLGNLFRSKSLTVSKRNLMLFLRPTIIRDRQQYQATSINQYKAFDSEQDLQRSSKVLDSNTLRLPAGGNTYTFRQVQSAIGAFYSEGR